MYLGFLVVVFSFVISMKLQLKEMKGKKEMKVKDTFNIDEIYVGLNRKCFILE